MEFTWSHCVLKVRDIEAMVSFYGDVLGFREADRGPLGPDGPKIVFMSGHSSEHHQLALVGSRGPEEATSLDHNAFRVGSIDDVKTMVARVSADERIAQHLPITHGNAVSVYFSDPEGNGIEVFCDTPWHVEQPQVSGWDPSQSTEEILAKLEATFRDRPGFRPMSAYQADKAREYGEA